MTKTQGTIVILLLVCLLIAATVQVVVDLSMGALSTGLMYSGALSTTQQPMLSAGIEAPQRVGLGEEFDLVVDTTNPHSNTVNLHSIDVAYGFVTGFEVLSISPNAVETTDPSIGYRSWTFSRAVDPNESLKVTFRLKALRAGQFYGDVDVNNSNLDFQTIVPIIRVVEEPTDESGNGE